MDGPLYIHNTLRLDTLALCKFFSQLTDFSTWVFTTQPLLCGFSFSTARFLSFIVLGGVFKREPERDDPLH
jgi:hypothetical protein